MLIDDINRNAEGIQSIQVCLQLFAYRATFSNQFSWRLNLLLTFLLSVSFGTVSMASEGDGIIESGENETTELARAAQNPVANMISLPFQNNTDFNFGPKDKTLSTTNIQPVIPFELNDDLSLIHI